MPTNYIVPTSIGFRLGGLNPATKPADLGLEFMGETAHIAFKSAAMQSYKRTRPYKNFSSAFGVSAQYLGGQSLVDNALAPIINIIRFLPTVIYKVLWSLTIANWKRYTQWLGEKILTLQSSAGGTVNTIKAAILKQFI
jgi:hypothetical protein